MSLVVNNNMMAANTARNLNAHYGRLATSTQRLSSGLRINSAADDAAGLAIRELQRADIAALHQGARNANDAISMIQVADGSLGIIDEKLIRMKELAEQAATGTYDSTQRLMIESEYQAMASEITRIANATDFNGTKLLDGTLAGDHDGSGMVSEGKMKIHFGTGNDSAEDYYYVEIDECTSEAFGLGNNSTWQDVQRRGMATFKDSLIKQIKASDLSDEDKGKLLASIEEEGGIYDQVQKAIADASDYKNAYKYWGLPDGDKGTVDTGFLKDGKKWVTNSTLMEEYLAAASGQVTDDKVFAQYLASKGLQSTIDDAKNLDTAKWNDARAEADKQTASDADAYTEYLKLNGVKSIDGAKLDTTADTGWASATIAAQHKLDVDDASVYEQYWKTKVGVGNDTPAGAMNNDATTWGTAKTAATAALNRVPTDDEVFSYYLKERGVLGVFDEGADRYAAAKQDTDWADAKHDVQETKTPGDDTIYKEYITLNHPVGDTIDKAKTNTDANKGWAIALENASKDSAYASARPATDEEVFQQYLKTGLGITDDTLPMDNAKADTANWDAAAKAVENAGDPAALDKFWNELRETQKQKLQYAWGQAALYNLAHAEDTEGLNIQEYGIGAAALLQFGADVNDSDAAQAMLNQALKDMQAKVGHMDFAGHTVETQEDAQMALDAINDAIVSKDKIRAHLGAAQNRLENTVSNLNIQAENLQAAESRISDVDVATEMTQFVRNQILTQSAVAMLSQANSLPQMAMQLIGG